MRSHNSGNIHGENLHIWAWNEKNYFSKTKINFYKKTTPQLLEHIGLQNMKVGEKTNQGDLPLFVWCILTLALKFFSEASKQNSLCHKIKMKLSVDTSNPTICSDITDYSPPLIVLNDNARTINETKQLPRQRNVIHIWWKSSPIKR